MPMRITGFSGVDIDSMVKELMKAKRAPIDKLNQQKTTLEWQRDQFRDVNIKLVDFRNNKLFSYGLSESISAKKATVTGETSAVTAKATSGAQSGAITVEVGALATAAYARSSSDLSATSASKLKDDLGFATSGGEISVGINGKTVKVADTATIDDLVNAINSSDANVTAYFDDQAGRLSLTSKSTGESPIALSSELATKFNLTDTDDGSDASVKINGISTTRSSNNFTVNGVEITLNAQTQINKMATIAVSSNTDKTIETIKSFISDYNGILDTMNNKVNEEHFRKYTPLTAEQKKELKESEIEMWEEKARSGLLRRDTTLTTLSTNMRMAAYTGVTINGVEVNLNDIGIETGTWEQRGKLIIKDEAKLRAAIEADPNKVVALFTQKTSSTDPNVKSSPTNPDSGLFNRLSEAVLTAIEDISKRAGTSKFSTDQSASFSVNSTIGERLHQLDRRMDEMNRRMVDIETRYFQQFAAMEAAMNRYSAQGSSLFGV